MNHVPFFMYVFMWIVSSFTLAVCATAAIITADMDRVPSIEQSMFTAIVAPHKYQVLRTAGASAVDLVTSPASQSELAFRTQPLIPQANSTRPSCCYDVETRLMDAQVELHFQPSPPSRILGLFSSGEVRVPVGTHVLTTTAAYACFALNDSNYLEFTRLYAQMREWGGVWQRSRRFRRGTVGNGGVCAVSTTSTAARLSTADLQCVNSG
jgi:hypothetical protein